jgi:phage-related protein
MIYQNYYTRAMPEPPPKPVVWVGSSLKDLKAFPRPVQKDVGRALLAAQFGDTDPAAKPLKGFGGAAVLEIVARHHTDTFRVVYTVRFADAVYVLHAFQKKAKRGIATPEAELEVVRRRLREAEAIHRARSGKR